MRATGIVRSSDDLGRMTISRQLGFKYDTPYIISKGRDNEFILTEFEPGTEYLVGSNVVRRSDDLGRIVMPRKMGFKNETQYELFRGDGGEFILVEYEIDEIEEIEEEMEMSGQLLVTRTQAKYELAYGSADGIMDMTRGDLVAMMLDGVGKGYHGYTDVELLEEYNENNNIFDPSEGYTIVSDLLIPVGQYDDNNKQISQDSIAQVVGWNGEDTWTLDIGEGNKCRYMTVDSEILAEFTEYSHRMLHYNESTQPEPIVDEDDNVIGFEDDEDIELTSDDVITITNLFARESMREYPRFTKCTVMGSHYNEWSDDEIFELQVDSTGEEIYTIESQFRRLVDED